MRRAPVPVTKVLTAGIGEVDLCNIDVYRERGGYKQWERTVRELQPVDVLNLAAKSGLRGRGGAGFPTGRKWSFLPTDKHPRYLVCNCDEAEPGTFKDHMLLETVPHLVLEGMLIGAYAIASHHAFMYIRGEFKQGYEIFCKALKEAQQAGYVGKNIFGSGYDLEVTVHRGAGAYICGEETALLNSLEGKRGEPRLKPPFPAVEGLYRKPTIVNNVETLAYLVPILERGAEWFAAAGTERSKGYKIVSVCGHVRNPGNYEVALGTTVREIIELAGGLRPGRKLMAVQPEAARRPAFSKSNLTGRTTTKAWRKLVRCSARVHSWSSTIRPISSTPRTIWCVSSLTSRAVSVRPAAKVEAGWSACSSGWFIVAESPATMRCCSAFPARSPA